MMKRVQKEKKFFISQEEIKRRHPIEKSYSTDVDYARFASMLRASIEKSNISDLTEEDKHHLALNLTMYQEDVISETGIWRAFTDLMFARYGKYVPFYPVDEDYLRDEPNFQDVAFIIWYTLIRHRGDHRQITNPETPALMKLAASLYDVLLEWFDKLPVNDDLCLFFEQAPFADDFDEQRDVLLWLVADCYLTYDMNYNDWVDDEIDEHLELFHGIYDSAECVAMRALLYEYKVGPLALCPKEWLAAILRANHNENCAVRVESQEYRRANLVWVKSPDSDTDALECEALDGTKFKLEKGQYNEVSSSLHNIAYGSFVNYDGKWYANGDCVNYETSQEIWDEMKHGHEIFKERNKAKREGMEALIQESEGSPFFFFENKEDMRAYLVERLNISVEKANEFLSKAGIYGHGILCLLPESSDVIATEKLSTCLRDERNPYYDSKQAKKCGFDEAISLPASVLHYAMEHDMLPDVGLNSVYGAERGQELFRENYDLLQRAIMGNDLVGI